MSALLDATVALASDLESEDYPTWHFVPPAFEPPGIILQPGDPYLSDEEVTFRNEYGLHLQAWLAVPLEDNDQATADLDALLSHFLDVLAETEWAVDHIAAPGPFTQGTWTAHGVRVEISRYINL